MSSSSRDDVSASPHTPRVLGPGSPRRSSGLSSFRLPGLSKDSAEPESPGSGRPRRMSLRELATSLHSRGSPRASSLRSSQSLNKSEDSLLDSTSALPGSPSSARLRKLPVDQAFVDAAIVLIPDELDAQSFSESQRTMFGDLVGQRMVSTEAALFFLGQALMVIPAEARRGEQPWRSLLSVHKESELVLRLAAFLKLLAGSEAGLGFTMTETFFGVDVDASDNEEENRVLRASSSS